MRKSFSFIELLVVMTLIGLIAAIGMVSYGQFLKQARLSKRKADLEQIRIALEMYRSNNNGSYPVTTGLAGCSSDWCGACSDYGSFVTNYITGLVPNYIQSLPHDPKEGIANTGSYTGCTAGSVCYIYKSDSSNYKLVANCGAETPINSNDSFYDPQRLVPDANPPVSYSLQISTRGGYSW